MNPLDLLHLVNPNDPMVQKLLVGVISTAVTGGLTWLATGGRRAIVNFGRTKVEIAQREFSEAADRLIKAHETPSPDDDIRESKAKAEAKQHLDAALLTKSITDGLAGIVADEKPSE